MMMDSDGIITYVNQASLRLLGYTSEELTGSKLHHLIVSEEARKQYNKALPEFKKTGQCRIVGELLEVYATRKDGTRIQLEISVSSFYMRGEWYSVGIMRDITERKRAEEALLESE
jgi:PAS domain S-box-containing protein